MVDVIGPATVGAQVPRYGSQQSQSATSVDLSALELKGGPEAPYISPYISVDINYNKAVLQIRDSDTGDVLKQFPSESRLQQIRQETAARQAEEERSGGGEAAAAQTSENTVSSNTLFRVNELASNISVDVSKAPSSGGGSQIAEAQVASQALASTQVAASSAGSSGNVTVVA